jgi:hypothetical protein
VWKLNCTDAYRQPSGTDYGLYWGLRLSDPAGGPEWKVDLWTAQPEEFQRGCPNRELYGDFVMPCARLFVILFITRVSVSAIAPPDYWPLQVGNRWTYHHLQSGSLVGQSSSNPTVIEDYITIEIVGTEGLEGQLYYRFGNGQLIRRDDMGNIIEYNNRFPSIGTKEMLVADFSVLSNDPPLFRLPYAFFPPSLGLGVVPAYPATWLEYPPIEVPAGQFSTLTLYHSDSVARGYSIYFSEGVGVVYSVQGGDLPENIEEYLLVHAVVDGREIGQSTFVDMTSWGRAKRLQK